MEIGLVTLISMLTFRVILPIVVTVGVGMLVSRWNSRRTDV